jgi:ABC-type Mn2+/Zn2+ transport system permease subunit/Mn-dependent DtxR family transcriptional regulator
MSPADLSVFDGMAAFWTVLVGSIIGVSGALAGVFLVLRRLSLAGDAIAHAVLPGLVIGYLTAGREAEGVMFAGAIVVGVLTATLSGWLTRVGRVTEDAGLGVVFTTLFALGILLVTRFADQVDLDPDCVLYGQLELIPLDMVPTWFGFEAPRALRSALLALVATVGFLTLFWKELKLLAFDEAYAAARGFRPRLLHHLFMGLVAGVSVAAFESVGSILVIAMLIVPAATARLLTDRLVTTLALAAVVATLSNGMGYAVAWTWNTSVAGCVAGSAGLLLTLAALFGPRYGIISRRLNTLRLSLRILREDILGRIYRAAEEGRTLRPVEIAVPGRSVWLTRLMLAGLIRTGQVRLGTDQSLHLTQRGRRRAERLVRSHRLWESYLDRNVAIPLDHLHFSAERVEHFIGPELERELESALDGPGIDPHGREIPGTSQPTG